MNEYDDIEKGFKKQTSSRKVLSCIFCSHPLIKSGTLEFLDGSKKKIKVCAQCNLPITEKDMEIIFEWEFNTGRNVYTKKADWKGIRRHFKLHKELTSETTGKQRRGFDRREK